LKNILQKSAIIILFLAGFFLLFKLGTKPKLPSPDAPPILYSNQTQDDLKVLYLSAIDRAKRSIHLLSYGLSDPSLLHKLKEKARDVKVKAYYDVKSNKPLPVDQGIEFHPIDEAGLMHQKILVVDEKIVFIGSANMTKYSLQMHDNLVLGLYSPTIAKFLVEKTPFSSAHQTTWVGGQQIDLWTLPDAKNYALVYLKEKIRKAQNKIFVSMFTLTHPTLIKELIEAHNRGVHIQVVVDRTSAKGASKKALNQLKKEKIKIRTSMGIQFMHHKFMVIDDKDLILGSTNWTKSAFYKNRDCFIVLNHLSNQQKAFVKKLTDVILNESVSMR